MKKIALLTGGPGYERNIALKSVVLFETYCPAIHETFILPEQLSDFIARKDEFEKVIPVFHGEYGEDGRIQAFLDILGVKYVGSSYFSSALCMNKREANIVAQAGGLCVPQEYFLAQSDIFSPEKFPLSFPVILKPNKGGSSYYTYKVENIGDLEEKIQYIRKNISDDLLIQEYILGEEYSVSLVAGEILDAIMFVEKNNQEDFFDYASKYESETGMRETFPQIETGLKEELKNIAEKVRDIFSIRGYARVDIIVRDGVSYFLEVNTIPGSTEVSILPKAWKLSGRSLEEFVTTLLSETY